MGLCPTPQDFLENQFITKEKIMDKELEKRYQKARKYADVAIELVKEGL